MLMQFMSVFCLCFPQSFIVSGLTFRSLVYFEFVFVYGVRGYSNFILYYPVFPVPLNVDCLLILPMVSFAMQKLLNLFRSHLFTFAFISITLEGGS